MTYAAKRAKISDPVIPVITLRTERGCDSTVLVNDKLVGILHLDRYDGRPMCGVMHSEEFRAVADLLQSYEERDSARGGRS